MKKSFCKFLGALVLAAGLVSAGTASAAHIQGSISFDASVIPDNPNLAFATSLTISGASVDQTSGDFTSIASGTAAFFQSPFSVALGASYSPVWSVGTASFNLASITFINKTPSFLYLEGPGTIFLDGKSAPGMFNLTVNSTSGATFQFGSDSSAVRHGVPEGGTAVALLGLGLIGLAGARRHFKLAKA